MEPAMGGQAPVGAGNPPRLRVTGTLARKAWIRGSKMCLNCGMLADIARLAEIDREAALVRAGIPDAEFTFEGRRFDVRRAAAIHIRGQVSPVPNLWHEGRRVSGLFIPGHGFPQILFEAHELPPRQRFTIAHELGHAVLDPTREPMCDPPMLDDDNVADVAHDLAEDEADAFAASMLMPLELVRADLARFGRCVALLADLFQITKPAMRARLRNLELAVP